MIACGGAPELWYTTEPLRSQHVDREDFMPVPLINVIYIFWAVVLSIAGLLLVVSVRAAWMGKPQNILHWRFVKMMSSFFAIVGFLLLVLSFEQMIRSSIVQGAENSNQNRMIAGRFTIAHELAIACSQRENEAATAYCRDLRALDNEFHFRFGMLAGADELPQLSKNTKNYALGILIDQLNNIIENVNVSRRGLFAPPILSVDSRISIAFFSCILVALSISGALGESIFQFRQAQKQQAVPK
jgi:hypothetical protein